MYINADKFLISYNQLIILYLRLLGVHSLLYGNMIVVTTGTAHATKNLLFFIYIDQITKSIKNSHIVIYADDIALYHRIEKQQDYRQLQEDITALCRWISDNYLKLNASKCCHMIFSKKMSPSYPDTPQGRRQKL